MRRIFFPSALLLVPCVAIAAAGSSGVDNGRRLIRELTNPENCVRIEISGELGKNAAADQLANSEALPNGAAARRMFMDMLASDRTAGLPDAHEIPVNPTPGARLSLPASTAIKMLLALGAPEETAMAIPDRQYVAKPLGSGLYLLEVTKSGTNYRFFTVQPWLGMTEVGNPLWLRLEFEVSSFDGRDISSTGQVIFEYPACLTAELSVGAEWIELWKGARIRNGTISINAGGVYLGHGIEFSADVPGLPNAVQQAEVSSDDPASRAAAVVDIDDQSILATIALTDKSTEVFLAAVDRIDDQAVLKQLAIEHWWPRGREFAVAKVSDQEFLRAVATGTDDPIVRRAAVAKLDDQSTLAHIALTDDVFSIRRNAVERIDTRRLLEQIAATSDYQPVTDVANWAHGVARGTLNINGQLIKAVVRGDAAEVKRLLSRGAVADSVDGEDYSALMRASMSGDAEIANILLDAGATVNARGKGWTSALIAGARAGQEDIVALLLRNGADVDAQQFDGATALMFAVHSGHLEITRALLTANAARDLQTGDGRTALYIAAQEGHDEIAIALLKAGANPDLGDEKNNSPLIRATIQGHEPIIKALLAWNAAIDTTNQHGANALMLAAQAGRLTTVQILIEKGAAVDGQQGPSALSLAAAKGHDEVARLLVDNGAQVDARSADLSTPLMVAAYHGHTAVVRTLLDAGASTDLQSQDGRTALMVAAHQGHAGIVSLLLERNASVSLRDADGDTAPTMAKTSEIRELLEPGSSQRRVAGVGEARSTITDGSYRWNSGRLEVEAAFEGELLVFDPTAPGFATLESGMTKEQVRAALTTGNVSIRSMSEDEWQAGDQVLIFVDGKLAKYR